MSEQASRDLSLEWIKTELQAVTVRRGDVLVLFYPEALSPKASTHLIETVQAVFPGHEVLLLDEGLRLGIAHIEDAEPGEEDSGIDEDDEL